MRGVAVLACFSGVLWGMPATGGAPCVELSKVYPALVTVQIYPGVYHTFDVPGETDMGIVA